MGLILIGGIGGAVVVIVIILCAIYYITKKGGGKASPPPVTEAPTRPEAVHVQLAQPAFVAPRVEPVIAAAVAPAVPGQGPDKFASLRELKALLDQGVLSQDEFDAEKKKVLAVEA